MIRHLLFYFPRIQRKKRGKKDGKDEPSKDGKKSQAAGKGTSTSQEKVKPGGKDGDHAVVKTGSNTERPESHQTEKSDSQTTGDIDKYAQLFLN